MRIHRVELVAAGSMVLDEELWTLVRSFAPEATEDRPFRGETPVFPVIEQDGRVVLLASFEVFRAVRDAGAPFVHVWAIEPDPDATLLEMALPFSI